VGNARATSLRVEAGSASATDSTRRPAGTPWLFGPASDLLLGCGGLYLLLVAVLTFAGPAVRALQPEFVFAFGILFLSAPHYGATLLRVYERRADRRSYWLFSVWSSLAIALLFVAGVYFPALGTLLFTLYLTWSPWHYSGQNYGLALMFLGRQGIAVERPLKRLIYASFVLSYALFFLAAHGPVGAASNALAGPLVGRGFTAPARAILFVPLGIPAPVVEVLLPAVAAVYAAVLVVAGALLWRRAQRRAYLLPVALLALTQALWFSLPYLFRRLKWAAGLDPFDPNAYAYYLMWLVIGHGVQYLWVTSYFARNTGKNRSLLRFYGKATLAGAGLWFLPWLLFAPGALGRGASHDGLLARYGASWLVLGAAINLHHFVLDGAIWKLRNHRIASVLLRGASDSGAEAPAMPWLRRLVWSAAGAGLAIGLLAAVGRSAVPALLERGRIEPAARILDALAFIGQDMPSARIQLGARWMLMDQPSEALRNYERSIDIEPLPKAFLALGLLRQRAGDLQGAAGFYSTGLELDPGERNLVMALAEIDGQQQRR
jgi:tetratricopeptide (TPR) repeat protein